MLKTFIQIERKKLKLHSFIEAAVEQDKNTILTSPYKYYMTNMVANSCLFTHQQRQSNIQFIWSCVSGHLTNLSPVFTLLSALFWSPQTPEGNSWLFGCWILCSPAANFVCVMFGTGQLPFSHYTWRCEPLLIWKRWLALNSAFENPELWNPTPGLMCNNMCNYHNHKAVKWQNYWVVV